jgi:hypothetical protein
MTFAAAVSVHVRRPRFVDRVVSLLCLQEDSTAASTRDHAVPGGLLFYARPWELVFRTAESASPS